MIVSDGVGKSPDILSILKDEAAPLDLAVITPHLPKPNLTDFIAYKKRRLDQELSGNKIIDRLINECSTGSRVCKNQVMEFEDYTVEMIMVVTAYMKALKKVHTSACSGTDQLCPEFLKSSNIYYWILESLKNDQFEVQVGTASLNFSLSKWESFLYDLSIIDFTGAAESYEQVSTAFY